MSRYLAPSTKKQPSTTLTSWAPFGVEAIMPLGFFALSLASRSWLALVNKYVPEPYLDEVFHIPQAQTYCEGRFWDWDDKITTPPGLYLPSVAYHKFRRLSECTPSSLRSTNVLATLLTALLAAQCRHLIEVRAAERAGKQGSGSVSFNAYYTGLNIALFPVIFFFSALYYTDVLSTSVVLAAYRHHLLRVGTQLPGLVNGLWTVVMGVAALFMRQTNIFWVVVYMGGLEVAHVLRSVKPGAQVYFKLHDPPLNQSGLEDWLFCGLTIAVTALCNPVRVLRQIWPHITILALFAGFVAWNGGVVLGDKSNHIATIHLAQMLYIWPLFAFFSAPLLIPSILSAITNPSQYLQSLLSLTSKRAVLFSAPYTLLTILLSLAIVQYNTIIHPFTLADNRHYMFYIFRHTILRSPAIRLSLVAVYTAGRWLVWDQLAGTSHATTPAPPTPNTTTPEPNPKADTPEGGKPETDTLLPFLDASPTSKQASSSPPPTSTALLWLLTTALSLITAPLVEPRYFILPWVFYRLLVPAWCVSDTTFLAGSEAKGRRGWLWTVRRKVDVRLVLETVWFVGINVGTMYMFLWRGFYWRGEDGGVVDGGR
ncbi:glycosyltransferase, partial [Parachaetomium inaequale]